MELGYPFHVRRNGRVATALYDEHIYQMIEQLLFTTPGERVNRPGFGCGLQQYVFAAESNEMVSATQFLVQGALQQWLGELIQVEAVTVRTIDSQLVVTVQYVVRSTQRRMIEQFQR